MAQADSTSKGLLLVARKQTYIAATVTFIVSFAMVAIFLGFVENQRMESGRLNAELLAQSYAQRIQDRLQSALTAAYVVGAAVRQSHGKLENFDDLAADVMANFPAVSAVQLAPDGIITQCFPLRGNEAAIGHNLLKDRDRNREAQIAIATKRLTMAGPFDLVQGGVGAVARLPVFLDGKEEQTFWGFATVLIRIPSLLDATGIGDLQKSGYDFEIWRSKPDSDERYVFARHGSAPPMQPVEYSITVPNGRWILSLSPTGGWSNVSGFLRALIISLLVASAIAGLQAFGTQSYLRALARAQNAGG